MFDILNDPHLGSLLYSLGVLCGILLRHYLYDVVKAYVDNKLKPGIVKMFVESKLKEQAPVEQANIPDVTPDPSLNAQDNLLKGIEDGLKQTDKKE